MDDKSHLKSFFHNLIFGFFLALFLLSAVICAYGEITYDPTSYPRPPASWASLYIFSFTLWLSLGYLVARLLFRPRYLLPGPWLPVVVAPVILAPVLAFLWYNLCRLLPALPEYRLREDLYLLWDWAVHRPPLFFVPGVLLGAVGQKEKKETPAQEE